jgi:hypothetical protein
MKLNAKRAAVMMGRLCNSFARDSYISAWRARHFSHCTLQGLKIICRTKDQKR